MARFEKVNRVTRPLLTCLVLALTFAVMVQASQTIKTPNAMSVNYNLAPGAISAAVKPVTNQPVQVTGVQNAIGNRGVADVTMLRTGIAPLFLEWVGIESTAGSAITQGFSAVPGVHIVFLDFAHTVDIEVASADAFQIHNGGGAPASGVVTLIW